MFTVSCEMPSTIINFAFIFCPALTQSSIYAQSLAWHVACRLPVHHSLSEAYGPRHSINLPNKRLTCLPTFMCYGLFFQLEWEEICFCSRIEFILLHFHSFFRRRVAPLSLNSFFYVNRNDAKLLQLLEYV